MSSNWIPIFEEQETSVKKPKYILITNGQSYVGYTAAIHIADQLEKYKPQKKHWKVKVLCEDKSKLKDLEKRGIEVHQVDYSSSYMISEQMKDKIKIMIFNPFVKSSHLMNAGKNLIDCAVKHKVKRIVMLSVLGCNLSKNTQGPLHDYYKLEKYLEDRQRYGFWTVFRVPFIQQFFYFWASMVENGILGLPLDKLDMMYDVNIQDICECLAQITLSKKHTQDQDQTETLKRVYELRCGPLSFDRVVSELSHALQEIEGGSKLRAVTLTDDQFKRYLQYMSSQETDLLRDLLQEIKQIDNEDVYNERALNPASSGDHKDNPNFVPVPHAVITPFFIDLMMDYMKMIIGNQPLSVLPNQDIRDLTGKEPIHVNSFFISNLHRFRPDFIE